MNAQHTHETKPSTARADWGDFENDELIKTTPIDYRNTPIGKKILKKGKLRKGFEYVDSLDIQSMVYESDGLGFFDGFDNRLGLFRLGRFRRPTQKMEKK